MTNGPTSEIRILRAALLWARNHLEAGNQDVRDEVIETLDRVLKHREPTVADMEYFREHYPRMKPTTEKD